MCLLGYIVTYVYKYQVILNTHRQKKKKDRNNVSPQNLLIITIFLLFENECYQGMPQLLKCHSSYL